MSLFLQESGSSTAPTILFLHGGGGGGWMWDTQVEALNDYHCLVPDLAEQGNSVNEVPFSIQGSANQIAEIIRTKAHGGKAHIVGLSEGAQIGVALLSLAPELVDHAIISSALVRPMPGASLITPGLIRFSYRISIPPFRNNDWWIRLNMKYAAGVPEAYYPQFKQTFQETTESGFTHVMIENQRFRLPAGLEKVHSPTLVVIGFGEYAAMRRSALDIAAAIPTAQAYAVHHTGKLALGEQHNWNMATPELFNETVRCWIEDRPLPGELLPLRALDVKRK